ncbi:MAG TPA: hypothetical protein VGE92_14685 [Steroidobacteraceae bacterium]
MGPKMRSDLPGTFVVLDQGRGAWRLKSEAAQIEVIVRGAQAPSAALPAIVRDLDIEWRRDDVLLGLTSGEQHRFIRAQTVIVHEPLANLYATLPLATLDANARRFWSRVFRLLRIPGGRHLLGLLAGRSRAPH